jgi:putative DNA-invertase from lambdoid prophage Rac
MKTILYCRVSTSDQTWTIKSPGARRGVRDRRGGFRQWSVRRIDPPRRALSRQAIVRSAPSGDVLVVRWVGRLGRNYADVTVVIIEFMKRGIVIRTVVNGLVFDGATQDPMQMAVRDALISFMAALSQMQAEATREAQRAGIEHAKARDNAYAAGNRPSRASGRRFARSPRRLASRGRRSTSSRTIQRGPKAYSRRGRPSFHSRREQRRAARQATAGA